MARIVERVAFALHIGKSFDYLFRQQMSTRFFTNAGENTLLNKFAGVFAHNPDLARFDALVGYLRASGYFALQPHLEKLPLIRILVGIDVDALLAASHRRGLLHLGDANKTLHEV